MAFVTDSFSETRNKILRDIRNQLPDADISEDSDYFVRASSVASVVTGIYQHQGWIVRQIFPDTADTEFLEWHCRLRDITRKSATTASGHFVATGEIGATSASGLVINRGNLSYTTTDAATIGEDGTASIPIIASISGVDGNTTAQATGTFVSAPSGFDSIGTIGVISGGTDRESDAEMLARLLELIRRPPAGGNRYDYKRWAMSVDGVTGAYIYPLRRGLGTVDTVITSADGLPSDEIIKNVQTYIDDLRPVTAKNHMVLAPTIKTVNFNISVSLSGVTLANATANIKSAIGDYFDSLQPGDSIIRSQIEMLISQITGVVDRDVNLPETNVTASVNASTVEWLRVGNVEVSTL